MPCLASTITPFVLLSSPLAFLVIDGSELLSCANNIFNCLLDIVKSLLILFALCNVLVKAGSEVNVTIFESMLSIFGIIR